jgi:hypothetical protein
VAVGVRVPGCVVWVGVGVQVAVRMAVGVLLGPVVAVEVAVPGPTLGVGVQVAVRVAVGVLLGPVVAVEVAVPGPTLGVAVNVGVQVAVRVTVADGEGPAVCVAVGPTSATTPIQNPTSMATTPSSIQPASGWPNVSARITAPAPISPPPEASASSTNSGGDGAEPTTPLTNRALISASSTIKILLATDVLLSVARCFGQGD